VTSCKSLFLLIILLVSTLLVLSTSGVQAESLEWVTFVDTEGGDGYVLSSSSFPSAAASGACYSYSGIHWSRMSVGYSTSLGGRAPAGASSAIQAGFSLWNGAGTQFRFTAGGNSVTFGNIDGPGKILAVATWWYDPGTKEIQRASIVFDEETWSVSGSPRPDEFNLRNVAGHEAGHWLSLNHAGCATEIMYAYSARGEGNRGLGSGDRAGIQYIYGGGSTPTGYTVTVTVKDSSGRAVSGATVYLDGTKKGTTDYMGKLVITGVTQGSHTIAVRKTGYQYTTEQLYVTRNVSITVLLQPG
jgi:hypothetical protein